MSELDDEAGPTQGPIPGAVPNPIMVGICMGSDSDLPVMQAAIDVLRAHEVSLEVRILSAHRTPEAMVAYGRSAHERGVEVIIAGAGGAAHLPGMLAALTPLPVIGVPVPLRYLDGLDSLLSIVQMPRGTPVATVAVGQAANAGHLALRILGGRHPRLRQAVLDYQRNEAERVAGIDAKVAAEHARGPASS